MTEKAGLISRFSATQKENRAHFLGRIKFLRTGKKNIFSPSPNTNEQGLNLNRLLNYSQKKKDIHEILLSNFLEIATCALLLVNFYLLSPSAVAYE